MKNKFKLIVYLTLMLILFTSCNKDQHTKKVTEIESTNVTTKQNKQKAIKEYEQNIKGIKKIKVTELDKVSAGKEIIVYLGRKTCSDCRRFSKILKPFVSKYEIYHIDSITRIKKSPKDLKKFRISNDLKTVPTVFKVKDGRIIDRMNINNEIKITPEKLQKFFNKK